VEGRGDEQYFLYSLGHKVLSYMIVEIFNP